MKKCKHPATQRLWWVGRWLCWTDAITARLIWGGFGARRCAICGSWLSLGESNDSTPAVRIEILGARFAADYDRPSKAGPCPLGECDVCQARHLAEEIRA